MRVAVLVPAHDEAAILDMNARRVWEWGKERFERDFTLVISENGSSDSTPWLARLLEKLLPGCVAVVSKRAGKGNAIKRAAEAVEADVYLVMDADLSADLDSAEALVRAVDGGADAAFGSRRAPGAEVERPLLRRAVTAAYSAFAQAALGLDIRDLQCGCKAFSRRVRDEIVPAVADDGFFFDTELAARLRRGGFRLEEIGIRWKERAEDGRKSGVKLFSTGLAFFRKALSLRKDLG